MTTRRTHPQPLPFTLVGLPPPGPPLGREESLPGRTVRESALLLGSVDDDATLVGPAAPVAVLRVLVPDGPPQDIPLPIGELTLGRGEDVDIKLDHSSISRRHLHLSIEPGRIVAT